MVIRAWPATSPPTPGVSTRVSPEASRGAGTPTSTWWTSSRRVVWVTGSTAAYAAMSAGSMVSGAEPPVRWATAVGRSACRTTRWTPVATSTSTGSRPRCPIRALIRELLPRFFSPTTTREAAPERMRAASARTVAAVSGETGAPSAASEREARSRRTAASATRRSTSAARGWVWWTSVMRTLLGGSGSGRRGRCRGRRRRRPARRGRVRPARRHRARGPPTPRPPLGGPYAVLRLRRRRGWGWVLCPPRRPRRSSRDGRDPDGRDPPGRRPYEVLRRRRRHPVRRELCPGPRRGRPGRRARWLRRSPRWRRATRRRRHCPDPGPYEGLRRRGVRTGRPRGGRCRPRGRPGPRLHAACRGRGLRTGRRP